MSLHGMMAEFEQAKRRYASGAAPYSPLEAEALRIVTELEESALRAVYAENNEGGKARGCVSAVARVLGVDITSGPGHAWSDERMRRVIDGAKELSRKHEMTKEALDDALAQIQRLSDDRDHWEQEAGNNQAARDMWKALAERNDVGSGRHQMEIRRLRGELDAALDQIQCLSDERDRLDERLTNAEELMSMYRGDVEALRVIRARVTVDGRLTTDLPLFPADGPKMTVTFAGPGDALASHWATPDEETVDALRATIVRQANEITELKGESK